LRAERAVVVGGGNTAMDAVRVARRLGARQATLVYRRSRVEMPARVEEVGHAEEEGVCFEMLADPIEMIGDEGGWVRAVRCMRMKLGAPDASGRRKPIPIPDSHFEIPCEVVVIAVGTRANPLLTQTTPDLKTDRRGYIEIDQRGMTSKPGVFAGGDIVRGAATVVLAMGDGKRAAAEIDRFLTTRDGGLS
jgi:glutamate synthase (NADPH/NADH) small chain